MGDRRGRPLHEVFPEVGPPLCQPARTATSPHRRTAAVSARGDRPLDRPTGRRLMLRHCSRPVVAYLGEFEHPDGPPLHQWHCGCNQTFTGPDPAVVLAALHIAVEQTVRVAGVRLASAVAALIELLPTAKAADQ